MWTFLFDLDGTILDTTELIFRSFLYTFKEGLGEDVGRDELLLHFGRPLWEQFHTMRPDLSEDQVQRLISLYLEHNQHEHDLWLGLVPKADVSLRKLKGLGYPLGIVTSKREDMARHGLEYFQLDTLFDVIVHMDSTANHKPHREPVDLALRLMGGDPKQAVYVGDSPYDIEAGRAAGLLTIGIVYNTFSASELTAAGAHYVVPSWDEIVEILLDVAKSPIKPVR